MNPRNAAAGTLRTLEPSIVANRRLDFYAYFLLVEGEYWPQGQRATLDTLAALGFRVNPHRKLLSSVEEMTAFIDEADAERSTLGYEIDGVVLKVDAHADAATARLDWPRAALGDRLQIHRQVRHHAGQRDYRAGGAHRQADAGGRARRRSLSAARR